MRSEGTGSVSSAADIEKGAVPMNESLVSPTGQSAGDAAQTEAALESPPPPPSLPETATRASNWTWGRIAELVTGVLVALVALVFLGGGGTVFWAQLTQREGGYATTDVHDFSTAGSALVTTPTDLGTSGTGWLYAPNLLGEVRIRVTPVNPDAVLFVGIGPSADVDRFLAGVNHTVISDFWTETLREESGGASASAPGSQNFWVASSSGAGARTLTWNPDDGSWTVVVMNADGSPAIDVRADLGARFPALPWIGLGLLVAGVVFAIGGALLISRAIRHSGASLAPTP
jgi:hypothetical protein